ncbi:MULTISPECIES: HAD family hydrolase [Mammaliicoccus]|uniref:HAD family hydrolase n=2 Tax=Mammaliicoccus vitulinus TaxID=71237 RepID=A0A2T4PSB3_9STAP|nr:MULTISPECIES: HAD family hydrolase [Mammaliicoccus]PTI29208.1 HAD family hydrolase [Mammaliicoccus vitulinus]PTI37916.1 HAD family hydrolase [Mammaliicoccus vitulinus]PTI71652.1 HAD family hydrolase [Mammaliicoccus vitulinus]QQT15243.1 HAD family hydrolase [Mammaliicoccus vitulinus]QQY19455.1 HAD family hydrolase [Mammaliicoccus vitulinus]
MIKWLLFDKDGTLLEFDETWSEISLVMIDRFVEKYHIDHKQSLQEELGYVNDRFLSSGILASGTLSDIINVFTKYAQENDKQELEKWTVQLSKDLISEYEPETIVIEGLMDTLKAFKDKQYNIAIITSDDIDGTERFIKDAGVEHLIDEKITASINGYQKPNPKMVEDFYKKWDVSPNEIAIIGDTPTDIQMGKNAHFRAVVGVLSGTGNKEDLADADYIYQDINEFYKQEAEWNK